MTPYQILESATMFFALPFFLFGCSFFLMREVIFKPYVRRVPPLSEELLIFFVGGGWIILLLPAMGTASLMTMLYNSLMY